jgi:hypothetical protein
MHVGFLFLPPGAQDHAHTARMTTGGQVHNRCTVCGLKGNDADLLFCASKELPKKAKYNRMPTSSAGGRGVNLEMRPLEDWLVASDRGSESHACACCMILMSLLRCFGIENKKKQKKKMRDVALRGDHIHAT